VFLPGESGYDPALRQHKKPVTSVVKGRRLRRGRGLFSCPCSAEFTNTVGTTSRIIMGKVYAIDNAMSTYLYKNIDI